MLLHEANNLHTLEKKQMNSEKANQMKENLEKAKKLTAMLNFKAFGHLVSLKKIEQKISPISKFRIKLP